MQWLLQFREIEVRPGAGPPGLLYWTVGEGRPPIPEIALPLDILMHTWSVSHMHFLGVGALRIAQDYLLKDDDPRKANDDAAR